jgi:nucleosome binding factor SPN SPT16 subunit
MFRIFYEIGSNDGPRLLHPSNVMLSTSGIRNKGNIVENLQLEFETSNIRSVFFEFPSANLLLISTFFLKKEKGELKFKFGLNSPIVPMIDLL